MWLSLRPYYVEYVQKSATSWALRLALTGDDLQDALRVSVPEASVESISAQPTPEPIQELEFQAHAMVRRNAALDS